MVSKIAISLLAVSLVLFPSRHRIKDYRESIKGLAWTTDDPDEFGLLLGRPEPENHCTTWAYHTPADPTKTHWITAAHCILDKNGAYQNNDYQIDGHPVYPENWLWPQDIASLSGDGVNAPGLELAAYQGEVGDELIIRGYPLGWTFLLTTFGRMGVLNAHFTEDPDNVFYNVYIVPDAPGHSGSPVFNSQDQVIGLVQIGWGRGFSPVSGGLDLATIRIFMNLLP